MTKNYKKLTILKKKTSIFKIKKKNILRCIYSKKYGVGSYDNNQSYIIDRVLDICFVFPDM